jgi:hypothetical protein
VPNGAGDCRHGGGLLLLVPTPCRFIALPVHRLAGSSPCRFTAWSLHRLAAPLIPPIDVLSCRSSTVPQCLRFAAGFRPSLAGQAESVHTNS